MPSPVPQGDALLHVHEEANDMTQAADDIITLQTNRRSGFEERPGGAWAVKHSVKRDGWRIALAVAGVVVAVDQVTKWWAWGHVPGVLINTGGDPLVGRAVGRLFVDRAPGALFDLIDALLLTIAMYALVRRRPPLAILVAGAVAVSGWASNVLDRLGLHFRHRTRQRPRRRRLHPHRQVLLQHRRPHDHGGNVVVRPPPADRVPDAACRGVPRGGARPASTTKAARPRRLR